MSLCVRYFSTYTHIYTYMYSFTCSPLNKHTKIFMKCYLIRS